MILKIKKLINNNKIFNIISKLSKKLKFKTYLIGGYVRDYFLFKKKSYDIDIVTTGNSIILAKLFSKKINIKNIFFFKKFKTAIIKYKNNNIEFVSTRKEYYNIYNNKPNVKIYKNIIEDQNRRDFTINSIAISLNYKSYGKIIDPFKGLKDIKNKIIKTPINPDITFYDDPLRMIRAIRFYTQLKFKIENKLILSIKNNIDRIRIIPIERIIQEFNKIIILKKPSIGLNLMFKLGFISIILPEFVTLKKNDKIKNLLYKKNFKYTLKVIDNISKKTNNLWLKWATLLQNIGKPISISKKFIKNKKYNFYSHIKISYNMVSKIFYRLKLPMKNDMKYVKKIIKYSNIPIILLKNKVKINIIKKFIYKIGIKNIKDIILLYYSNIIINNKIKKKKKNNIKNLIKKIKKINKKYNIENIKLPINGNDIIKIFNIKQCKKIGIIKNYIIKSIINGKIKNNYNSVYKLIIKKGKKLNLNINEKN
ncbi:MAG: HD domain-containing protein [Candidatus Shikimatogenerans bostrichidophilus]|nr:MAG: HD domain-containing protein [Candidatus Shikimatogenerans bostrichidophilus]